jgi:UDP-N-acetylglucosamine 2-epimerase (non-hydrolysing)
MKRVMILVGARPNMMKAAAILKAMAGDARFITRLVHTGQHYDDEMSKVFFQELQLPEPDVYLGVGSLNPLQQMGRILMALEPEVMVWKPDKFIVVGDVNSTVMGALVANKLGIQLVHVEAGLRSFDRRMPEELNRILTDHLSDLLFTPSRDADENLQREGIPANRIFFVGNVMVDTLLRFRDIAHRQAAWDTYRLMPGKYALLTLHRPSNVDNVGSLEQMVNLLVELAARLPVIFPIHPRTRSRLQESGLITRLTSLPNIIVTPPLGYLAFLSLMTEAGLVLTDSGGIQEETTVLGVPCLTLRENTERPVTITQGTNTLAGTDPKKVLALFDEMQRIAPFGSGNVPELWDGRAANRIVEILAKN